MVKLRFYWDGCATFEDEDEYTEMELVENYEGDSWEECCDDCASCSLDWDDADLVTGESDCMETSREFERIEIWDKKKKEYKDVPQEITDYYSNAVDKLQEQEFREQEEEKNWKNYRLN